MSSGANHALSILLSVLGHLEKASERPDGLVE
jgi:hypothetical protein